MDDKIRFKERQFAAREDAILDAANALMARKGYELMSLDEIASVVGVAKGSLYKHFPSKEALAAATMTRLLQRTLAYATTLPPEGALARIRALLGWCLRERLAGAVPHLPATSHTLMSSLLDNAAYVEAISAMNELLSGWVAEAKRAGELREELPDEVVLFTVYARTCDPTLEFLKMSGQHSDAEIVELMLEACFSGLATPPKEQAQRQVRTG